MKIIPSSVMRIVSVPYRYGDLCHIMDFQYCKGWILSDSVRQQLCKCKICLINEVPNPENH